jgi:nicotinamide-nucleotide amidase
MRAEIITIGDEILIGQIIDTNSAWIAEQLNLSGIEVYQITSVHDDHEHIKQALANAEKSVDLVLITGGLGPTRDDITKNTLCEYFNTRLVFHEPTFNHIRQLFENRGIDLNKLNRDQALVPESCTVIPNTEGTAPCMWFERNQTIFVSMPGIPFEMKAAMNGEILPRLLNSNGRKVIVHKTVLTQGVPESMLAVRIEAWENALPSHIKLAYLPNPMSVRLRLSAIGTNKEQLEKEIETQIKLLQQLLPSEIFGYNNDTMSFSVGELLKSQKATLSVAESCTGGYISHLITLTPGASEWFTGSITAYDNTIKTSLLGVSPQTIEKHGAVSEQTVIEMAQGIRKRLNTQFSVATSGIAGPGGESPGKPVGTVWIAVQGPTKFLAEKFIFGINRERNIMRSSQTALQLLRKLILVETRNKL